MPRLGWEWAPGYPRPPVVTRGPWPWFAAFELAYEPRVDICDERDRLVVYVDLPGVLKEDIKLQVRDSSLELEATRGTPKETVLRERVNRFYRVIVLPCAVKAEEVTAKQENGVLTVTLRKVAGKAVSVE